MTIIKRLINYWYAYQIRRIDKRILARRERLYRQH
jgi:hypothetical protein